MIMDQNQILPDPRYVKRKEIKKKVLRACIFIFLILLLILFDQWTKILAAKYLRDINAFVLIPGVLELRYLENTGAAFSMMANVSVFQSIMKVLTPLIVLCLFVFLAFIPAKKRFRYLTIDLIFIIAGALGNYVDRLIRQSVIDFIYFSLIDFPIFNVADIYVTCSVIFLFFLILFYLKDEDLEELKNAMPFLGKH